MRSGSTACRAHKSTIRPLRRTRRAAERCRPTLTQKRRSRRASSALRRPASVEDHKLRPQQLRPDAPGAPMCQLVFLTFTLRRVRTLSEQPQLCDGTTTCRSSFMDNMDSLGEGLEQTGVTLKSDVHSTLRVGVHGRETSVHSSVNVLVHTTTKTWSCVSYKTNTSVEPF